MTRKIFAIFSLALICLIADANTSTDGLTKVGEGKLRVVFWDIYKAELYAASKQFDPEKPYALNITYLRDLSKEKLLESTKEEMLRQGFASAENVETWMKRLTKMWVDVKEGNTLSLRVNGEQVSTFHLDQKHLGEISDKAFAKAFSSIWLSEKARKPKLRKALLNL